MKRIVIDARLSGTTTGRYIDKLVEYLYRQNPNLGIVIVTKSHRKDYMQKIAPQYDVRVCDVKEFTFAEQITLNKVLLSLKADLVHFPMVQQPLLYRRPAVTSMLDLTTTRFKNPSKNSLILTTKQMVYKYLNRFVAKRTNQIITISNYVRDELIKTYKLPPEKVTTTYCSADRITDATVPIPGLKDQEFIMYVGQPLPHKNLTRLIDAFVLLHKKHPKLKLVLVGKKDVLFEQHEKRVVELGLNHRSPIPAPPRSPISDLRSPKDDSVVFTGFVSEGQLRWLYENCQAYVFPSLSEGFGLPGLEAMVHGAPVVSSNATCLPEVYGHAAHYFSPHSTKEIAEKIDDVLSNKTLRSTLIKRGYQQIKKYSWTRMARKTLEVYNKVLDTQHA